MTASKFLFAVALCTSALASAQSATLGTADESRGTSQLPTSASFADEASVLTTNPAGLGRLSSLHGVLIHERSNARRQSTTGAFLSWGFNDIAGVGLSFEWIQPLDFGAQRTKTALGFSAGPSLFSVGLTSNWFSGYAQNMWSLDLGVQSRLTNWLSLGGLIRNLNTPQSGGVLFAREYIAGVGFRPFGPRFSLGVDYIANEALPVVSSRLQYTASVMIISGLTLMASFSHSFNGTDPLIAHGGLGIDLANFGYRQGVGVVGNSAQFQFAARFSSESKPSLVHDSKVAVVSMSDLGGSSSSTIGTLLGVTAEDRYLRFIRFLERAADDPELTGLVLKVEGTGVGLARADEIRTQIVRLKAHGKKVVAYMLSVGDAEYLASSACDAIYAAPEAMFMVDGLRSSVMYFGGLADNLGIDVDVARVGAYKNFPDQFTRRDMSDEQRETLNAYLDRASATVADRVTTDRKLTKEQWTSNINEGLRPVFRAKALGEIDGVMTPQQLDEELRKIFPTARVVRSYRPFDGQPQLWSGRPQIAVIPVLGNISGGQTQPSPLGGELISGAETFIESLNRAVEDPDVAAIVLRIDSGGGDGMASDMMYRAVLQAKKRKPVVASMGDVAASGGYYVAMGADTIWASPTTLTGSIGVFFAKPGIKRLANKFDVIQESITRGNLAGVTDYFDPWSPEQKAAAQKWVDSFYDTFITEVAASRKLEKDTVDKVARGRVWSGADAHEHKLVDHLGGMMDAIHQAMDTLHLGQRADDVDIVIYQPSGSVVGKLLSATAPSILEQPLTTTPTLPATLAKTFGPVWWLLDKPAVQTRLEYVIDIR